MSRSHSNERRSARRLLISVVALCFVASTASSCKSSSKGIDRGAQERLTDRPSTRRPARHAAEEPLPEYIGVAEMKKDGTIILSLRAVSGPMMGDGMLVYPPSHPDYAEILEHLGGMKPGQTKPVRPWPDEPRSK